MLLNETASNTILRPVAIQEENALVKRAISGETRAQHIIYKKYVNAMFHTVIRMVGSREDAEDVTQEVFTKVFQRLDSFRGESTLGAWIKRVTINTTLNYIRQKKKLFLKK